MADEITTPGVSTEGPTAQDQTQTQVVDTPQTISKEEHDKAIADYQNQISQIKKSQSGSDKMIAELRNELAEERKKGLSQEDSVKLDLQRVVDEKKALEIKTREFEIKNLRSEFMLENKVDARAREFLWADTEDGLKNQLEAHRAIVADEVKAVQEQYDKLKAEMGRPGGGAGAQQMHNPFIAGEHYSVEAQTRLYKENRELYDRFLKESRGK